MDKIRYWIFFCAVWPWAFSIIFRLEEVSPTAAAALNLICPIAALAILVIEIWKN